MKSLISNFAEKIPLQNVNPSLKRLESSFKHSLIPNERNIPLFRTKVTSRSADKTTIINYSNGSEPLKLLQKKLSETDPANCLLISFKAFNKKYRDSAARTMKISVIVSVSISHTAYMLWKNFIENQFDSQDDKYSVIMPDTERFHLVESDIVSIIIPEWTSFDERFVFVNPIERVTCIGGIDYYGEIKMSILRMAMEIYRKDFRGLGVHAGSKMYSSIVGKYNLISGLIFGLSGSGKTTVCFHNPNSIMMSSQVVQDDINFLMPDGSVIGSEVGFYVKCDNCPEHKEILEAVTSDDSFCENVSVDSNGNFLWKDFSHTKNTRSIVSRKDVNNASPNLSIEDVNFIIFITRRPHVPPIGKLISPEQAAAYYALGESIITSAENDQLDGMPKRQVGFDPFILGEEHINIHFIRDFVKNITPNVYLVNTGYVGDPSGGDITVGETMVYIKEAIQEETPWTFDEDLKYMVPEGLDSRHDPRVYYKGEFKSIMNELRDERKVYLSSYSVDENIIESV